MAARRKGQYAGLVRELVGVADNLEVGRGGIVVATSLHEIPVNEFGIPVRQALVQRAIDACGGKTDWKGYLDVHHIGWPHSRYRSLSSDEFESAGEAWRDLGALKVRAQRQKHEYLHTGFEQLKPPAEEVMVQMISEDMNLRKLRWQLHPDPDEMMQKTIDPIRELARHVQFLDLLDSTPEGQVGHMPMHEYLAGLSTVEARKAINDRIGILTIKNEK